MDSTSGGEDGDNFVSLFALSHGKSKWQSQQSMVVMVVIQEEGEVCVFRRCPWCQRDSISRWFVLSDFELNLGLFLFVLI